MDIAAPERKRIHQGRNTKRWREIMGITQTEVGDFLEITQQAVSKLEEKEEIEEETLEKISQKINIPVDILKNKEPQEHLGGSVANNNLTNNEIQEINAAGNGKQEINYFCCIFNPLDKVTELYERLLEAEREKKNK